MSHPDEQMLLAYIRQQPYDDWPGGMQQHIARCPLCEQRYAMLMQTGSILEAWAHSRPYQVYPALTGRILQQLNQPKSSRFGRVMRAITGPAGRFTGIPVTVALLILFCVVLLTLAYRHVPLPAGAGSDHIVPTATVVVPQITPLPYPKHAVPPKKPTPGATPTSSGAYPKGTPTVGAGATPPAGTHGGEP